MFCTQCGRCLPEVARFCTQCGATVAPPTPVDQPPVPVYQSVEPSAPVPPSALPLFTPPLEAPPKKKFGERAVVVVIAVFLITAIVMAIVAGALAGWAIASSEDDPGTTTAPVTLVAHHCNGLTIYLKPEYQEAFRNSEQVTLNNSNIIIGVSKYTPDNIDETYPDIPTFMELLIDGFDISYDTTQRLSANGVEYVVAQTDGSDGAELFSFYLEGNTCWMVRASIPNLNFYGDEMVETIATCEID